MRRPQIGDQVYLQEDGDEVGAVRDVRDKDLIVYVEGTGDFVVTADQVAAVHTGKVILTGNALDPGLLQAIRHAHDREEPGV